ncbi:MAG: LptF/LptG family permease [Chlamydiae bacterium]|nr:LptF/LptG family permease [Chlamydiota bacterium]
MPILWRYLICRYFQVFCLSIISFICILLVTRFEEIARFASTGAPIFSIFLFTIYQMPTIIPIAIPISCLISAILLFQNLSQSNELTAIRMTGLSFFPILFPVIFSAILLTIINFTLVSEFAPRCQSLSKGLIYKMVAENPLSLLQRDRLVKLKKLFIDMKVLKLGKYAKDVIFITKSVSNQRLGAILLKELSLDEGNLIGKEVVFISSMDPKKEEGFDHLIVENQAEMIIKSTELCQHLHSSNELNLGYDHLPTKMIFARKSSGNIFPNKIFNRATQEIAKRISLSLAALTFTLIGASFGMQIGRIQRKKGLIWAICLSAGYMLCFLVAKSIKHSPLPSIAVYLIPHLMIFLICYAYLRKISRGVE